MNSKYNFKMNQLLAWCTLSMLAPALRIFPGRTAEIAGKAAWITPTAVLPVLLLYIYFISKLMDAREESEGLAELCLRVTGDKAGKVILALFSLWYLLYAGFILRAGANRLITSIYPYSSPSFFMVSMAVVCLVAALGSVRAIVRSAKIVLPLIIGLLIIILTSSLGSLDKSSLLPISIYDALPVMKASIIPISTLTIVIYSSCFFFGHTKKEKGTLKSYSIWVVMMLLLVTSISICVVGSFGSELAGRLSRPFFSLVRNIILFRSLERLEALLVNLWIFPDFLLVSMVLHASHRCLRLIIGCDAEYRGERLTDMSRGRWIIYICSIVSLVCGTLLAPSSVRLEQWSEAYIPAVNLFFAFIMVPLIFIIGKARKQL